MKFIKNMRIGSATLFGLSLLSFAGNLWGMELNDDSNKDLVTEIKNIQDQIFEPGFQSKNYRILPVESALDTYEKLLRNNLGEFDKTTLKQKVEIFKSEIIKFEFWNKLDKSIYVRFGNFDSKTWITDNFYLEKQSWIQIKSNERIFSPHSITQFTYSLNKNPQSVSDVEYFIFNPEENNKVFIKLEKKGENLKFMTQKDTSQSGLSLGKIYKIGRDQLGVKKGQFSVTQTGLSLENSIEDKDIEWLPYLYLPYNEHSKALYKFRGTITSIIEQRNEQASIQSMLNSINLFIVKNPDLFNTPFPYNWTPAHEVALWKTSNIYENNDNVKNAIDSIATTLTDKHSPQVMKILDIWGKTPQDIQNSPSVKKAVNQYLWYAYDITYVPPEFNIEKEFELIDKTEE